MPKLVAPDGILYEIKDKTDLVALAKRRTDLPPMKNLNQLFSWVAGPNGGRAIADNWQLLDKVKWAENVKGTLSNSA